MARDFSVYEKELNRMQGRDNRRSSGGGDYTWLTPDKPAKTGDQTRQKLRIVPRRSADGEIHDEFWVSVDQHIMPVSGKTKVMVCPDNHDDSVGSKVCPLCKLSRELYASREPEYLSIAKELSTRVRVFANVINVDDASSHVDEKPMIWAFSRTIHNALLDICVAKRAFIEDPEVGRDILLTTRRIGPNRIDIRYAVTDMDPSAIDPSLMPLVPNAHDLESLAKGADLDEMREIAAQQDPREAGSVSYPPPAVTAPAPAAPAAEASEPPPAPAEADLGPVNGGLAESGISYHLHNSAGSQEGLSAADIAKAVLADESDTHNVWTDSMDGWAEAATVEEIAAAIEHCRPKAKGAPPAPPKAAGGPPVPPTLPGRKAF